MNGELKPDHRGRFSVSPALKVRQMRRESLKTSSRILMAVIPNKAQQADA